MEYLKRVAIYKRVSTTEQAEEGYSLDAQENTLRTYCDAMQYEVVRIYSDEGISAKDIIHRPQMCQLLADAKQNKFDIVLVWKLTRFTRSLSDLCSVCDMLDKYNISFVSYSESFDCSTSAGRMMRNILGVVAQWEREVISDNVKSAMRERAMQGKRTCSYILGYDLNGDSLTVNEKEASYVQKIYDLYLQHQSLVCVEEMCKTLGITGKLGKPLSAQSIHIILTRFIYCGFFSWHRVPIKSDFTAIISPKKYNEVQHIIEKRGIRYGRKRYAGLVFLDETNDDYTMS